MERIIYVPIERLQERYSSQWDDWFEAAFKKHGIPFIRVGDYTERHITQGEFLDVVDTNQYKNKQISQILATLKMFPKDSYTIFFTDVWFPGIEMIAYVRDALKMDIRIVGMLHAGTYDPHDFLTRSGMRYWGRSFEQSVINICDKILLATDFHRHLIGDAGLDLQGKSEIVEWPVETDFNLYEKDNIVVFPHRLAPEKQPDQFDVMMMKYGEKYGHETIWVRTKDVCKTKDEYYKLLARAKVSVSTALQETYGIAMVESVNNGCIPVAPNRLSYKEVLRDFKLYEDLDEAVDLVHQAIINYKRPNKIQGKEISWLKKILQK